MKLTITEQKKNPFLHREEMIIEIISDTVPSSSDLISEIGKDKDLLVVKKINTNFGQQKFIAEVFVYENVEIKERIETIPQKVRKKLKEEKKKAEEEEKKKKIEEKKKAEEDAKASEDNKIEEGKTKE